MRCAHCSAIRSSPIAEIVSTSQKPSPSKVGDLKPANILVDNWPTKGSAIRTVTRRIFGRSTKRTDCKHLVGTYWPGRECGMYNWVSRVVFVPKPE